MLERVAGLVVFHFVPGPATLVMPVAAVASAFHVLSAVVVLPAVAALIAIDPVALFEVELVFALLIVSESPSPFEIVLVSDTPFVSEIVTAVPVLSDGSLQPELEHGEVG